YAFDLTGKGVHVYVLDSGIVATHPEFAGRANLAYQVQSARLYGHGSHVAGLIGGLQVGVAKEATVHGVRVLGCDDTSNSDVVEAIDWVVRNAQRPAVINMSLGPRPQPNGQYQRVRSIDDAIARAIAANIPVIVAAGNDNLNACSGSPAGSPGAIVVGATSPNDTRAAFSNFGPCLTLFAPGDGIVSASNRPGPNGAAVGGYATFRGTSQAAPLVAGVVAQMLQANPELKPADIAAQLRSLASPDVVGDPRGSPN
ncbi:peptidase S8/S53 domain-containing protein, partial [Catenaria anguillulae PL171]